MNLNYNLPAKKYLWIGLGIAIISYFWISHYYAEQGKILRAAEYKTEKSISVLPQGVEETWIHYIKKRVAEEIQREGRNLKVRNTAYLGIPPSYAYVSLNHPYEIECNDHLNFGIIVSFGTGEDDSISATITGDFSPDHKNEPDRKVPIHSIASENLDKKLCQLVAQYVAEIISDQSIQP